MEYDVDLNRIGFHDLGDIVEYSLEDLETSVIDAVNKLLTHGKFPIILGGEHSITPHVVSAYDDVGVVILDAHLDHRDTYEGMKNSHATASRRVSELTDELLICGVRSISSDEIDEELPQYITSGELSSMQDPAGYIDERVKGGSVYLSIDMDVLDPSFAPGVGNPEPFGIKPKIIKDIISRLSDRLVGMDIVEVTPEYDPGEITSNLAARLVYELIGSREGSKR